MTNYIKLTLAVFAFITLFAAVTRGQGPSIPPDPSEESRWSRPIPCQNLQLTPPLFGKIIKEYFPAYLATGAGRPEEYSVVIH